MPLFGWPRERYHYPAGESHANYARINHPRVGWRSLHHNRALSKDVRRIQPSSMLLAPSRRCWPLLVLAQQDGQGLDKRREMQGGLSTFAQQSSSALAVLRPYIIITLECKVNRVILHSLRYVLKSGSPAAAIRGGPQRSTVACSGTQAQSRLARL